MRPIQSLSSLACLAGVVTIGSVAGAETVYFQQGLDNAYITNYSGTSDTSFNSASNGANPGYNNGNMGGSDFVMSNQTRTWEEMRTLFRFDLSSLTGLGLSVNSASLILRPVTGGSPDNINVFLHAVAPANAGWEQGTSPSIVYNASPGSATWNEKVYQTTPWAGSPGLSTPGTDYDPTPVASGVYIPDDSTPLEFALPTALVQSWINTPADNAGLMLLTDNNPTNSYNRFAEFFTSEVTNSSLRPTLSLDIGAAPEPGWRVDSSGDWNNAANWVGGNVPNGAGAVAGLGGVITSARTVYTDTAVTVGTLKFDNANTYVIAGAGSLTIQASSGNGSISVAQGAHKVNLPLSFASDTDVNVADGATLTIGNPATIQAGKTVTKTGAVKVEAPLTLEAGATLVTAGGQTSLFGAPALGIGAKVDVKNSSLTIDYRGLAGQADAVKAQLASGYNSGAWNGDGINTSSAVQGETGLGWMDDAANQQVLIKYTYAGDATLDGKVDVGDLGALASNWQLAANWSGGDFDYSGTVNVGDLGILATNWQKGSSNPLGPSFAEALAALGLPGVSVPEPAAAAMIGFMGGLMLHRRRRQA